jgi:hypothetical protein
LGGAVLPCYNAKDLRTRLHALLADPAERLRLGGIGRRRMGPAGGSGRLARAIANQLLDSA